jgi:hypothetical protein
MKEKSSKTVSFTLTNDILSMLKLLAEKHSNSMSYEIRRLVRDEYNREVERKV